MRPILAILTAVLLAAACDQQNNNPANEPQGELDSIQKQIVVVTEAIEKNPGNDKLYIERAKLHQKRGDFRSAYLDAQKAVQIDSSDSRNLLDLGNFAFAADQYVRAEDAYLRCIRVDNKNTDCMAKLAEFYLLRKKYQEAIDYSNMALQVDQQLYRPYFVKGWAMMETGDSAKAASAFQTAVELNPNFYDGFIMLGSMFSAAKKDIALQYFNSALAINPSSTEARYYRGMHYQVSGRNELAEKEYELLSATDSTDPRGWYNRGYIRLNTNDLDSAIYFFSQAIRVNPKYAEAFYNRGYSNELKGNKELAASDYKLSLSLNPKFELAIEGLKRVQ